MAIASTVRFTKGATVIDINGPSEPQDINEYPQWVSDQTVDGTRFTYRTHASTITQWTIALRDLTPTMKADLRDFFITDAKGPENTFTYRHTDGDSYTARFIDTAVPRFRRNNDNNWDVTIRLELTAEVAS